MSATKAKAELHAGSNGFPGSPYCRKGSLGDTKRKFLARLEWSNASSRLPRACLVRGLRASKGCADK